MSTSSTVDPTALNAPVYVTTERIAEVLDCHPRTIVRLARRKLIPQPVELGGLRRWPLQLVLAAIEAHR